MIDVDIPEVRPMSQSARFFEKNGANFVEISFVGSKDTSIQAVKPEHMAKFRDEWNAFCDGQPVKPRKGTPLTDIPGVTSDRMLAFIQANVHTAEELAALSDAQCQGVGHGTLTARQAARQLLQRRAAQQTQQTLDRISEEHKKTAPISSLPPAELGEIKEGIASLNQNMTKLVELMLEDKQRRKGGRPKKDKGNAAG